MDSVKDVGEYEKPLSVSYRVKGTMGSSAGKRLVVPADLFLSDERATFPHEKREVAVYFNYPRMVQDALRINFHNGFVVEATPAAAKYDLPKSGAYTMEVTSTPTSFTTRRNYIFNDIFVLPPEYPQLRGFYSEVRKQRSGECGAGRLMLPQRRALMPFMRLRRRQHLQRKAVTRQHTRSLGSGAVPGRDGLYGAIAGSVVGWW